MNHLTARRVGPRACDGSSSPACLLGFHDGARGGGRPAARFARRCLLRFCSRSRFRRRRRPSMCRPTWPPRCAARRAWGGCVGVRCRGPVRQDPRHRTPTAKPDKCCLALFSEIYSKSANTRPHVTRLRRSLANIGQALASFCQTEVKFGPSRPNFAEMLRPARGKCPGSTL